MSILKGAGALANPPTVAGRGVVISMNATPQMMAVLEQMSQESGQPLDVVFTQAIALYRAALNVTAEGKHLGYTTSPDALEVEFTDIVSPEGSSA